MGADARTAVVTGSARRVGRAIAAALVADGWQVLVHARAGERARVACEELGAAGWVGADLEQADAAPMIANAAAATFGWGAGWRDRRTDADARSGLDLLVNSASSFERVESWGDAGIEGWKRAMAVNARAPYLLTGALLPALRTARGLVVNVSDHAAHAHWPTFPIHAASKAALESLTLSGAQALAGDGVRMCAIAPGTILPPDSWDAERIAHEAASRGVGTPHQLIDTILELAADPSRSGEILVID